MNFVDTVQYGTAAGHKWNIIPHGATSLFILMKIYIANLNDSVDDMDDSIGGKDINSNNCAGGSSRSNSDSVLVPGHGNLFTTSSCEGSVALGNIGRLKKNRIYFQAKKTLNKILLTYVAVLKLNRSRMNM
jgi:hypothetical protein